MGRDTSRILNGVFFIICDHFVNTLLNVAITLVKARAKQVTLVLLCFWLVFRKKCIVNRFLILALVLLALALSVTML
jgi:hypothetical protein